MNRPSQPVTPAVRVLRRAGIEFDEHPYDYLEGGGTAHFATVSGVDHHGVVKTLVMADERRRPLLVLMHGDREVSTKALARQLGVKAIRPVATEVAERLTGYRVGGISPFGIRRPMPIYLQRSVIGLERVYINGGRRGYLVSLNPADLLRLLDPVLLEIAQ